MAILDSIEIRGYRSIKEIRLELGSLNLLIGANGAGKSNFVSFFKLLNEMMGRRLQQYIGTSGRAQSILHFGPKATPQLEAILQFRAEPGLNVYQLRLAHAQDDTLIFTEESLEFHRDGSSVPKLVKLGAGHAETRLNEMATQGEPTARVVRHLLNQCRVYHFHDTSPTARVRQHGYIHDNRWLMPDAGNLAAMLYAYRETAPSAYSRVLSAVRKVVPEFDDFDLEPDRLNPNDIRLSWRKQGHDYLFGPHQISDGSLRAIALCTLLLQPEDNLPDVIILDEPELGLHPHALEIIAGLIRAAATRSQIIAATQSQSFVDYFGPSEIVVVEAVQGRSSFRRLDPEDLRLWLEDFALGELWQRNVLGGGPLP